MRKIMLMLTLLAVVASASAATEVYMGMDYYSSIYACELDGGNPVNPLVDTDYWADSFDVAGGYMYAGAGSTSPNSGIYRYELNGSNPTTLLSGVSCCNDSLCVTDNYIYYVDNSEQAVKRMDLDGGNVTTLVNVGTYTRSLRVSDNAIYYLPNGTRVRMCDLDGSNDQEILNPGYCRGIAVGDNYLYYLNYQNSTMNRCDLDGSNPTVLMTDTTAIDTHPTSARLLDGRLYWSDVATGGTVVWSAAIDGSESSATAEFNPTVVFGAGSSRDVYFDFDVTPEPATMMIMAAGIPILLKHRRRQSK